MRITGGEFRGRTIARPKSDAIRPTSDRVREALFSILASHPEAPAFEGIRVLDLFAGTGALGFEALSRGASEAIFVDQSADARGLLRETIENLKLEGRARLLRRDATKLGPALPRDVASLAFIDPPYGRQLGERALAALAEGGWLAQEAVAIVEERANVDLELPSPFELLDRRVYGDTALHILKLNRAV